MRCQFRATSVHSLLLVSYVNKLKSTISLLKLVSETREIIAVKGTNGRLIAFKRPLFIRNFVEENNPIDYKYNLSNRINNKKLIIIQRLRNSNRASYPSQTQNQMELFFVRDDTIGWLLFSRKEDHNTSSTLAGN